MKRKIKATVLAFVSLAAIALVTGCSSDTTPYETNNLDNYSVSVKYDANGGSFTTNTSVIVDSYNLDEIEDNKIALLSPDNASRGNDAFEATKNGYFLAGWYAERTESTDENGETVYSYSQKWDFENELLEVDSSKEYASESPVLTLYAAWVPLFEIEFYNLDDGEYMDSITFDPMTTQEVLVPVWDEETGAIEMNQFPEREGYTFNKAYYDEAGKKAIKTAAVEHPGSVNEETGTAENNVLKIYVDWTEGEWYHIYNVEQFVDNASVNGNYELHADLDFTDENWPTSFMYGNFGGTIKGNGHTIKNIELEQTKNSKANAGLFGFLTETAKIKNVTFENVQFTIEAGTRVPGTNFGLFAGSISSEAVIKQVKILNSQLLIDSGCYFGVDDYSIGLVCGMGDFSVLKTAEISCGSTGDNPESIVVTAEGNEVSIEYKTE